MPSPLREKRATRHRGSEEEFVLFLQGIPAHCRWQELKDLVRQTALHIRQAVVYDDQHGFPTGLGQIIVKNEDEAWRTYHRLSTSGWEGQSLVVTLARTSSPTRPIAGPTKSPTCIITPSYIAGYSTPPRVAQNMAVPASPISPEPVISPSPTYQPAEYGPVLHPMALPPQPLMPIFADPLSQSHAMHGVPSSPALRHSFCDPLALSMYPPYHNHINTAQALPQSRRSSPTSSPNTNTMPPKHMYPNFSLPSMYPHPQPPSHSHPHPPGPPPPPARYPPSGRRTIFIQNLSSTTTTPELHAILQEAGPVKQVEMPVDGDTGRCKGFARVTFSNSDEAKRAVAIFNNAFLLGAKIRVKIDRTLHVGYSASSFSSPANKPGSGGSASALNSSSDGGTGASAGVSAGATSSGGVERSTGNGSTGATSALAPAVETPPAVIVSAEKPQAPTKAVDRCQPLVVNGSGIGRTAVAT